MINKKTQFMPGRSYFPEFPGSAPVVCTNELVRKTYALLAATLLVTALAAVSGMGWAFPHQHPFILMILAFGALFVVLFTGAKQSPLALPFVFVFTSLVGLSLGPMLAVTLALSVAGEFVLFNRSWYNRAGVEWVMDFCSEAQYEEFIETVPVFEQMLVRSGIHLLKYYLDIDKTEQKRRLKDRLSDPLKQWKMSPIDAVAQKHWKAYSTARNAMFARTHSAMAPWTVVRANDKKRARLGLIMDLLSRLDYKGKDHALLCPDPEIVFAYTRQTVDSGAIAP